MLLIMVFTFYLSGGTIGEVSVSWRVSDSTADAGLDYTASGGSVNFGPGETRQGEYFIE